MKSVEQQMEARTKAVEQILESMVLWYLRCNSGKGPDQIVELKKFDSMLRWCDPPIPHIPNPLLIEGHDQEGRWHLKTDILGNVS